MCMIDPEELRGTGSVRIVFVRGEKMRADTVKLVMHFLFDDGIGNHPQLFYSAHLSVFGQEAHPDQAMVICPALMVHWLRLDGDGFDCPADLALSDVPLILDVPQFS